MQTLFDGTCQDIAVIETIMRGSGRMANLGDKTDDKLWDIQRDFKSSVFTRVYECSIDKQPTIRMLAVFARVKFQYDNLKDFACIKTNKEDVISIKDIILSEMACHIGKVGLNGKDRKIMELLRQQGEPQIETISKSTAKAN
jgi:hypothetical protein